ncbi:MAG: acyltransferase [Clostridia bacterium]|nr:acyltransferase [Clostridia bacterium]
MVKTFDEKKLVPLTRERNVGIDLLRMVSMFLVAVLHVLGQGGILSATGKILPLTNYKVTYFLEIAAYCAVNCYAIISGYVGVKSKFKYSNIIMLWLQVAFYTLSITAIFAICYPGTVGKTQVINALFPVMKCQYWYFTAYFCMFFFTPFLNWAVNHMPRAQMRTIVISLVVMFSVLPTLFKSKIFGKAISDVFLLGGGYSAIWLGILYVIGAYISKYDVFKKIKAIWFILLYLFSICLTWLFKFEIKSIGSVYVSYTSPTILLAGVSLVAAFSKFKLSPIKKVVAFLSPLSFGVYLIHVHPLIWNKFMLNRYIDFAEFPTWKIVLAVLLAAFMIYAVCSVIDLVRHYFFKLIRLRKGLDYLEKKYIGDFWSEK